jgi:hypothetical protein
MIYKNLTSTNSRDPLKNQGNEAEKKLAFYLRRHFKDDPSIHIFNDLLLEHNDENAQIDHLVLFKYGFIIIESKSCLGTISYNQYDEWKRRTGSNESGFDSPFKQIDLQYKILIQKLNNDASKLLGTTLSMQKKFGGRVQEKLVSIDANAILERCGKHELEKNVVKSDSVSSVVNRIVSGYTSNLFTVKKEAVPHFNDDEIKKIIEFLLSEDKRSIRPTIASRAVKIESKAPTKPKINLFLKPLIRNNICSKCGTEGSINMQSGRYGYYLKCNHCNGNENVKEKCPNCDNTKTKIKKCRTHFYLDCECGFNELYFVNSKV